MLLQYITMVMLYYTSNCNLQPPYLNIKSMVSDSRSPPRAHAPCSGTWSSPTSAAAADCQRPSRCSLWTPMAGRCIVLSPLAGPVMCVYAVAPSTTPRPHRADPEDTSTAAANDCGVCELAGIHVSTPVIKVYSASPIWVCVLFWTLFVLLILAPSTFPSSHLSLLLWLLPFCANRSVHLSKQSFGPSAAVRNWRDNRAYQAPQGCGTLHHYGRRWCCAPIVPSGRQRRWGDRWCLQASGQEGHARRPGPRPVRHAQLHAAAHRKQRADDRSGRGVHGNHPTTMDACCNIREQRTEKAAVRRYIFEPAASAKKNVTVFEYRLLVVQYWRLMVELLCSRPTSTTRRQALVVYVIL